MDMQLEVGSKSVHDSDSDEDFAMEDGTMSVSSEDDINPKQFWRLGSADTDKTAATTEFTRDPIIRRPFWVYDFPLTSLHKDAEPIVHKGKIVKSCLKVKTNEESVRKQFLGGSMFASNFPSSRSSIRKKTKARNVSFSELEIREYEVIVSDNPSVSSGPGIGLGWCYEQKFRKFEVEAYEEAHPPRRKSSEIQIPKDMREKMLLEAWGVPSEEIARVRKRIIISKCRRRLTVVLIPIEGVQLFMERWNKRIKRLTGITSRQQRKKKMINVKGLL